MCLITCSSQIIGRAYVTMVLCDLQKFGILKLFWKGRLETKHPHSSSGKRTCFLLVNFTAIMLTTHCKRGFNHPKSVLTVHSVRDLLEHAIVQENFPLLGLFVTANMLVIDNGFRFRFTLIFFFFWQFIKRTRIRWHPIRNGEVCSRFH